MALQATVDMVAASPYPSGRMCFHICFMMVLGTLYSYSTWSERFIGSEAAPGPFLHWTAAQLSFVYSMGILGNFLTPVGGFLYDSIGPARTYLFGLSLTLIGSAGLVAVALWPSLSPPGLAEYSVGLLYYIEEQGSSTIYMGIIMDTLTRFPAASVGFSTSLVLLGYSMSSIAAGLVMNRVPVQVPELFAALAVLVTLLCVLRLFVLGDLAPVDGGDSAQGQRGGELDVEASGGGGGGGGGGGCSAGIEGRPKREDCCGARPSPAQALLSPAFGKLAVLSIGAMSPVLWLLGLVKAMGTASGVSGGTLAEVVLLSNALGRMAAGVGYDRIRHRLPSSLAILANVAVVTVANLLLLLQSTSLPFAPLLWAGCMMQGFLYGGTMVISASYIKDNFAPGTTGTVFGANQLVMALGNMAFSQWCSPATMDSRQDFALPFAVALSAAISSLLLVLPGELRRRRRSALLGTPVITAAASFGSGASSSARERLVLAGDGGEPAPALPPAAAATARRAADCCASSGGGDGGGCELATVVRA